MVYTSEHVKWLSEMEPLQGVISNCYYPSRTAPFTPLRIVNAQYATSCSSLRESATPQGRVGDLPLRVQRCKN